MKRTSPWYRRYPTDFFDGTRELSLEQRGALNDILDWIYTYDRPVPDDAGRIAHYLHCNVQKWVAIRKVLLDKGKLVLTDQGLTNPRAEREIKARAEVRQTKTQAAIKREGDKRAEKEKTNGNNAPASTAVPQNGHYAYARENHHHQKAEKEEEGLHSTVSLDAAREGEDSFACPSGDDDGCAIESEPPRAEQSGLCNGAQSQVECSATKPRPAIEQRHLDELSSILQPGDTLETTVERFWEWQDRPETQKAANPGKVMVSWYRSLHDLDSKRMSPHEVMRQAAILGSFGRRAIGPKLGLKGTEERRARLSAVGGGLK